VVTRSNGWYRKQLDLRLQKSQYVLVLSESLIQRDDLFDQVSSETFVVFVTTFSRVWC